MAYVIRCHRCNTLIDNCSECRLESIGHSCKNGNWIPRIVEPKDEKDIICLCDNCHDEFMHYYATVVRTWWNSVNPKGNK